MKEEIITTDLNKIIKYTDKDKIRCIGKRIAYAREKLLNNMTRKEFSDTLNRSPYYVGNRERGQAEIETAFLLAIMHKFGISLEWLVNGIGNEFSNKCSKGVEILGVDYSLLEYEKKFLQNFVELNPFFRRKYTKILNDILDLIDYEINATSQEK